MKKLIVLCLLIACSTVVGRHHSCKVEAPIESFEKISLQEFSELVYNGFTMDQMRNFLIECPAGSYLPFKFAMRGEIFAFEPNPDVEFSLKLTKTCYLKYQKKAGVLLSTDMVNWRDFDSFVIGKASGGIFFDNQTPGITLAIELDEDTKKEDETRISITENNPNRWTFSHYHNLPIDHPIWQEQGITFIK